MSYQSRNKNTAIPLITFLVGILLTVSFSVYATSLGTNLFVTGTTGIASTSPWGLLSVNPSGVAGPEFVVGSSTRTDFIVTNAGNLGIGTTSPGAKLHIQRDVSNSPAELVIENGTPSVTGSALLTLKNDAGVTGNIGLKTSTGSTYGSYTANTLLLYTANTAGIALMVDAAGPIKFSTGASTERARFDSSGNLGIGTTSPWRTLSMVGTFGLSSSLTTGTTGNYLCINTSNYEITSGTTCSASSERFKDNIKPLSYGLKEILKLNPVSFTYKKEYNPDPSTKLGLIAEQVNQYLPELVAKDKDNLPESVDYAKLTPILIRALQQEDAKLTALILNPQNTQSILDNGITIPRISSSLGTWSIDADGTLTSRKVVGEEVATKKLAATDTVVFGSAQKPIGMTIFDQLTKQPSCITLNNGIIQVAAGICGATSTSTQPAPSSAQIPDRISAKELCIGDTCLTESEIKSVLRQLIQSQRSSSAPIPSLPAPPPPEPTLVPIPTPAPPPVASSSPGVSLNTGTSTGIGTSTGTTTTTSTSTKISDTASSTTQKTALFDVGAQPVSGTSSSKPVITVIVVMVIALGAAFVFLKKR